MYYLSGVEKHAPLIFLMFPFYEYISLYRDRLIILVYIQILRLKTELLSAYNFNNVLRTNRDTDIFFFLKLFCIDFLTYRQQPTAIFECNKQVNTGKVKSLEILWIIDKKSNNHMGNSGLLLLERVFGNKQWNEKKMRLIQSF